MTRIGARSSCTDVGKTFTVVRAGRSGPAPQARGAGGRRHRPRRSSAGSMVGYIGPNGAGKSTTIKMLIGILVPSRGHGAGRRHRPEPRSHRGRPPHRRGVRPAHPAVVGPAARRLVRPAAPRVPRARGRPRGRRSAGWSSCSTWARSSPRRCASSRSASGCGASWPRRMLHRPPVLFLDEPTIGLDVVSKEAVRTLPRRPATASRARPCC